jgi:hypothetical protein
VTSWARHELRFDHHPLESACLTGLSAVPPRYIAYIGSVNAARSYVFDDVHDQDYALHACRPGRRPTPAAPGEPASPAADGRGDPQASPPIGR